MNRRGDAGPNPEMRRARRAACVLAVAALVLSAVQIGVGERTGMSFDLGQILRGLRAVVGLDEPLQPIGAQVALEYRLWRTLTALGVGACLGVAGAFLQGLFRNPLASPSLVGVTAGANLGASIALLVFGGYGTLLLGANLTSPGPWAITLAALVGALIVSAFVIGVGRRLSRRGGIATLLLLGVAVNTCIAGVQSAMQDLLNSKQDYETLKTLLSWSMGTLTDRAPYHAVMVWSALAITATIVPFVGRELDLLAGGEDDARSLGVDTDRLHRRVLFAAALTTACAVAAAGQIGFIGLVIPHLLRLSVGSSHRALLWLSMLGGAVFILLADSAQLLLLHDRPLNPGPLMSLIGGPFFLVLLIRHVRRNPTW